MTGAAGAAGPGAWPGGSAKAKSFLNQTNVLEKKTSAFS
jgi:hypothetical protein